MDDHYDQIHELVRREYDPQYQAFQELIAEIVIKTQQHKTLGLQERFDKIIVLFLGSPKEKITDQDKQDFLEDIRRAASLSRSSISGIKSMTLGEAAAVVARQRFLPSHKIGDKIPKDIDDEQAKNIENYTKKIKRHFERLDTDELADQFKERGSEEERVLLDEKSDIIYAKSLISEWLDLYAR